MIPSRLKVYTFCAYELSNEVAWGSCRETEARYFQLDRAPTDLGFGLSRALIEVQGLRLGGLAFWV